MKKILSVLLVLVLVVGLCACGGSGEKKPEGLQAGYARESIMPDNPVGLGGFANENVRLSQGYLDIVYVTCIAFSEGEDTVLMLTIDSGGVDTTYADALRKEVSEATGVPIANITLSSSHSHACPVLHKSYSDHCLKVYAAAATAAKNALADQSPATLYAANVQTEGMNFVRHYIQGDGSYTSANLGNFDRDDPEVKHAREADHEMVLIRAERAAEDKNDIVLMNWAAHPCYDATGTTTTIHADYIGTARTAFEQQTGMHFAFIQGGGGDAITDSGILALRHNLDRTQYGEALAKYAIDALPTMEKVEGDGIKVSEYTLEYACNHYGEDKLADAQRVMEFYTSDRTKATALADSLGFYSINHAKGIVRAASNPEKTTINIGALYIGGVGFATAPVEMFSQTSMYVKDNSPFEYTVFCTLTNGAHSYIPISDAHDYPSYEGFVTYFAKGAAEAIADQMITMLKDFQ